VREELAFVRHDQCVALFADPDAVDHPPHRFEVQAADQPPAAVAIHQTHRDDRGRQQVVVNREPRDQCPFDVDAFGPRNADRRSVKSARYGWPPCVIEQRQLPEFGELKNEVLEDAILLPALEAGLLQIGADGLENLHAAGNVQLDLFSHLAGNVEVADDNSLLGAAPQGDDRHRTIRQERQYGGGRHQ
jgi:hypothetical protein